MGNPHPTKSKPFKIGRKHTGALSVRRQGRIQSAKIQRKNIFDSKWNKYRKAVASFWRGERDNLITIDLIKIHD